MHVKSMSIALAAMAFIAAPNLAGAGTVYDTDLAAPGFYNGSGNANGHFVTNTENNVEIGLRTSHRQVGPVTPTSDSTYNVPTGNNVPQGGANRAWWNFEYSVNLRADGTGTLTNADNVNVSITVVDVRNGTSVVLNPFLDFPDNSGWNGSKVAQDTNGVAFAAAYGFQNSENLTFGQFAPLGFNMDQDDTYFITMSLSGAVPLMLVSETVVVGAGAPVPVPAALPLFASGLGMLGFLVRRRKQKAAVA
jgi:hypothetical protein